MARLTSIPMDRELQDERRRDRADLDAEHASVPMPATCGGCGARIFINLWPQVYKTDSATAPHVCVDSAEGQQRLLAIEAEGRRANAAAARRRKRARR